MTTDSNICSGRIAAAFPQVLAAEELLAATKKVPAKKVPLEKSTPGCEISIPKGKAVAACKGTLGCPKKKAGQSSSPEVMRGWTLPSQPHV